MNPKHTILCPTDFSECSLNAIEYAARLGEKYKSRLLLLHVANKEDYLKLSPNDQEGIYQQDFLKDKLKSLQKTVEKECLSTGLESCEWHIVEGSIVNETLAFAQKVQADLIVVGTEGMNDLRKNIIGSRASRIVEEAEVDVMVIPRKVFFKKPRKLIYATDYIEEDKLAIQKVIDLAKFFKTEIDVVHASPGNRAIDKSLHQEMTEELKPFIKYPYVNFVLKSFRDDLALGLETYLQTAKGDMLVTLSQKKDFFDKIFKNSLSKKMAYFINKPLWVVKSF